MRSSAPATRLLAASLILLSPLRGLPALRAQEAPAPSATLEQLWEDVLLLDALSYLRLSHGQLQQVPNLIRTAEGRFDRLQGQQESNVSALERLLGRHRDTLLKGRRTAAHEQENALILRRTLRGQRSDALDQLVPNLAARLARIVQAEQAARAWRLAHNNWPERLRRRPALQAPESGFVLTHQELQDFQTGALRQALARRFPRAVTQALGDADPVVIPGRRLTTAFTLNSDAIPRQTVTLKIVGRDAVDILEARPDAPPPDPARDARRQQIRDEAQRMRANWDEIAAQVVSEASPAELEKGLEPLTRRLLCSRRFIPTMAERLGRTAEGGEVGDREQRLADRWEDVLLLDAARYLLLSPDQMENLLTLGRTARALLDQGQAADAAARAAQRRLLLLERETLLNGARISEAEHEQVVRERRAAGELRIEREKQVARKLAPEVAKILTRDQAARAYLLARAQWPSGEAKSPLLLDPESGFVLDPAAQNKWREDAIRGSLARRFGNEAAADALGSNGLIFFSSGTNNGNQVEIFLGGPEFQIVDSLPTRARRSSPRGGVPDAALAAAREEHQRLTERWNGLASLLENGDFTPTELELALRPFVRRVFPSPRWGSVVEARLERGTPLQPEELLPPKNLPHE